MLNENKYKIHKASDRGLSTYVGLIKMNGIKSKAEQEMFEKVEAERARRRLHNTINAHSKKKGLRETIQIHEERKIERKEAIARALKDHKAGKNIHQNPYEFSSQAWHVWNGTHRRTTEEQKLKEDAPTNSMGTSSSTSGPIKTYDPLLKKKKILKRFKEVTNGSKE